MKRKRYSAKHAPGIERPGRPRFMLPPFNRCPFCKQAVWFATIGPDSAQIIETKKGETVQPGGWSLQCDPETHEIKARAGGRYATHACEGRRKWQVEARLTRR